MLTLERVVVVVDGRQAGLASTNDAVRQPLLHFEESLGGVCVSKVDKHSITVKLQIRAETPHPAVLKQISKSPFVSVSLRPFDFDASKQQTVMACVPYSGSGKEGGRGRGGVVKPLLERAPLKDGSMKECHKCV